MTQTEYSEHKIQNGFIDLNTILRAVNFLIVASIWYIYLRDGGNRYINLHTIWLSSFLSAEIYFFLFFERKTRNPLLIIFCLQLIVYYLGRILSLSIFPFSVVFLRYPFNAEALNYSVCFLLFANFAIFLGLYSKSPLQGSITLLTKIWPAKPTYTVFVLFFCLFMVFAVTAGGGVSTLVGLLNSVFFNVLVVILMLIVYLALFYRKLTPPYRYTLVGGLIFFAVFSTLTGSRSAITSLINLAIFVFLAVFTVVRIKRIYLFLGISLIPILIIVFSFATYIRPRMQNQGRIDKGVIDLLKEFSVKEALLDDTLLAPIFDRIAFLDYGAEIIAHREHYEPVFNFKFYLRSLIDNVLTPGFDVFDSPRASNALSFIYNNYGDLKKSRVGDFYQSDQFTLFGECYVMFGGWLSLLPLFLIAYLFKWAYSSFSKDNPFKMFVKRALVLYLFNSTLASFGLDWVVYDCVGCMLSYVVFKNYFKFNYLQLNAN